MADRFRVVPLWGVVASRREPDTGRRGWRAFGKASSHKNNEAEVSAGGIDHSHDIISLFPAKGARR